MPTDENDASANVNSTEVITPGVACPPSTSPQRDTTCPQGHGTMSPPAENNTAVGMRYAQEESMYEDEKETKNQTNEDVQLPITPVSIGSPDLARARDTVRTPSPGPPPAKGFEIRSADDELDRACETQPWDFTKQRLKTTCPSSLFQNGSKYIGSQQSDRQIYNVAVTILTVDMEQCMTSGYLEICGLTPDHPRLTTFFTGEIIGGPDQKYSFRTKDPGWGASDKTDVTHWARFPPWRPLSPFAKVNMDFNHPVDGSPWWQQVNIFMRWKEHFLVPDYKLRSIQGASFEGFYYICLNQIAGTISGIYFHSKSEKYQQLELQHEGPVGIYNRGVRSAQEFR